MPDESSIAIVTYNSSRYIRRLSGSALEQEGVGIEVVVVDNASTDNTRQVLRNSKAAFAPSRAPESGFAEAQNRAIRAARAMGTDPESRCAAASRFIRMLVDAAKPTPGQARYVASSFRSGPASNCCRKLDIDSTGIFFTPQCRHFDRGWHQSEHNASRARSMCSAPVQPRPLSSEMIDDIAVEGSFFDPILRLSRGRGRGLRAQLLGWRCIYTPAAVAYTSGP